MPTAPFSAAIMLVRYGYSFLLIAGKVLEDLLSSKILVLFNLLFNHEKYDNDDDESAKTSSCSSVKESFWMAQVSACVLRNSAIVFITVDFIGDGSPMNCANKVIVSGSQLGRSYGTDKIEDAKANTTPCLAAKDRPFSGNLVLFLFCSKIASLNEFSRKSFTNLSSLPLIKPESTEAACSLTSTWLSARSFRI